MSKNNDWFSSLQRSNEVIKRLCGATTALSQLAESAAWIKIFLLLQILQLQPFPEWITGTRRLRLMHKHTLSVY